MNRRDLFKGLAAVAVRAAVPVGLGMSIAQRIAERGLSMQTWRLVEQRMGAKMFSTYAADVTRATGYLGYFVNDRGQFVGVLGRGGELWKTPKIWNGTGRALERIGTAVPMDHRNPVNW